MVPSDAVFLAVMEFIKLLQIEKPTVIDVVTSFALIIALRLPAMNPANLHRILEYEIHIVFSLPEPPIRTLDVRIEISNA